MSGKESVRNGIIVIVLLIGFGVVSAVWPILAGSSGQSHTRAPVESEHIELTLPFGDQQEISLTSFQAMGILAVVAIALIGGGGVTFAFVSRLLSGQTDAVLESEAYKSNVTTLTKREGERLKAMQEGRKSQSRPEHQMPRWSMASTTLIYLMFAAFFGYIISGTFYPENELVASGSTISTIYLLMAGSAVAALIIFFRKVYLSRPDNDSARQDFKWVTIAGLLVVGLGAAFLLYFQGRQETADDLVHSSGLIIGLMMLLVLPFLIWQVIPSDNTKAPETTDNSPIPWDFIWVLMIGLLVVGLGIGLIVYFNVPV